MRQVSRDGGLQKSEGLGTPRQGGNFQAEDGSAKSEIKPIQSFILDRAC